MRVRVAGMVLCAWAICAEPARPEMVNGIKAIVHESPVTFYDVTEKTLDSERMLYRRYYSQPDQFEKEVLRLRKDTLDQLMNRQLILHEFKTAGYNLPKSVVDERVNEIIRSEFVDRRTMIRTLNEKGTTFDKFWQSVQDNYIIAGLTAKNISQEIIVSPKKVKEYYDLHQDEFKVEDEVKVRLLTLPQGSEKASPSAQELGEEFLDKLKSGATFADLAAKYSPADKSRSEGVWYESSQLTRHLADILASLKPGEHSGLMSRSAGDDYWICKYEGNRAVSGRHYAIVGSKERLVEEQQFDTASAATNLPPCREFFLVMLEAKRAAHIKPLDGDLRAKIEHEFVLQERARLEKQWLEKLKKKTFVRIFPG